MRDHVTEELISAYVDGELDGDELKLAEDLLAESAEHRQLLAEFRAMRASMWSLPNHNLPADFHTRVVDQIDELKVSPSKEPPHRDGRGAAAVPWGSVLLATASLAAVVTLTVMLRPVTTTTTAVPRPPVRVTPADLPIYFQQTPKYVLIYDVTITLNGQQDDAINKLLNKLGIGIDPALRLDDELEQGLRVIRESKQDPNATEVIERNNDKSLPDRSANDKVEMIYVASNGRVIDKLGTDLEKMYKAGKDVSRFSLDLGLAPEKIDVMNRLHESATTHFALNSNTSPTDLGHAFRLLFDIELTSASVPGAAAFPAFSIRPEGDEKQTPWEEQPWHILLIIRNASAHEDAGE